MIYVRLGEGISGRGTERGKMERELAQSGRYYGENNRIEETARELLGRELFPADGIRDGRMFSEAEQKLQVTLPNALKCLYYFVGRQEVFMSSFQQILLPDALWCEENHLFFALENQEVCSWSVDLTDLRVYQNVEGSRYPEEIYLEEFLILLMYYNFAECGYEYSETKAYKGRVEDFRPDASWKKVVHHNGLVIYAKCNCLLWFFYDIDSGEIVDGICVAARTKEELIQIATKQVFEKNRKEKHSKDAQNG